MAQLTRSLRWFKTECNSNLFVFLTLRDADGFVHIVGLQKRSLPRNCALCSHAVLQRSVTHLASLFCWLENGPNAALLFNSGDEPLVILDTLEDWRFAKNVRPMASSDRLNLPRFHRRCVEVAERTLLFPPFSAVGHRWTKHPVLCRGAFEDF